MDKHDISSKPSLINLVQELHGRLEEVTPAVNSVQLNLGDFSYAA